MARLRALVAGATGLVGRACVETLLARSEYEHVTSLGRRSLGIAHPSFGERVTALDRLEAEPVAAADHAFCALGTTRRAAGSSDAFRRVDLDMVAAFAAFARRSGVERFVLVSSIGADPRSSSFYLRVKGEAEQAAAALGFRSVHVLQPGLLLGHRAQSRPGEALAQRLAPALSLVLRGPLRPYRPIPAPVVGAAMVGTALAGGTGIVILRFDALVAAAAAVGQ